MKFKPASNYEALLIQAKALYTLLKSKEKELKVLQNRDYMYGVERVLRMEKEIESQRIANEQMTTYIESLESIYLK